MGDIFSSYRNNKFVLTACLFYETLRGLIREGWSSFLHAVLLHTSWIDPVLVLGSEISGWVLSKQLSLFRNLTLLLFIFFLTPSYTCIAGKIVRRPPCKSTSVQPWQQAVADSLLQALFKILMPLLLCGIESQANLPVITKWAMRFAVTAVHVTAVRCQ